jgi:hypothetical protein
MYRGFDPHVLDEYGFSTFTIASPSQTPFNSYYLLKEYLPKIKARYIVLDLYWELFANDGVESGVDLVSNAPLNKYLLEMSLASKDPIILNSFFYAAVKRLHTPLAEAHQEPIPKSRYAGKGYVMSAKTHNQELHAYKNQPPVELEINPIQIEYLHKIIALAEKHDVKIILVSTPVIDSYKNSIRNYHDFEATLNCLASKNQVLFLDYNKEPRLALNTATDFFDKDHLTQVGVRKFNQAFVKDFQDLNKYSAKQHRRLARAKN